MKNFVYILLNKKEQEVTIKANNECEAYTQLVSQYGKDTDPMMISIDGTKLEGFGGIEPRAIKYQKRI